MINKIDLSPIPRGTGNPIQWYEEYTVLKQCEGNDLANTELGNLNRINIFIGQNNSGKSRLLRKLYAQEDYRYYEDKHLEDAINLIKSSYQRFIKLLNDNDLKPREDFISQYDLLLTPYDILTFMREGHDEDPLDKLWTYCNYLISLKELPAVESQFVNGRFRSLPDLLSDINSVGREISEILNLAKPKRYSHGRYKRIYIPILRGLRPLMVNSTDDYYADRIFEDHFKQLIGENTEIKANIRTGLDIFQRVQDLLLGTRDERERVKLFEKFIGDNFYNGREITLIPNNKKRILYIGIGKEKEVELFNLGDGVQAIITILYPIFFESTDRGLMVFIEEPENSLHPGYQRLLVEALMDKRFSHCQFFFTTHSNHFLDISLDTDNISIYTFHKKNVDYEHPKFEIQVSSPGDIKILDLIGVHNASVFLANCTIWVEGITDRLYIRKYLELYQNKRNEDKNDRDKILTQYTEDIHYSFVEYGGSNITHWQFDDKRETGEIKATRICKKIFLVADKDNTEDTSASKKAIRLKNLKSVLNQNFYVLNCREIENTIQSNILGKVISVMEDNDISRVIKDDVTESELQEFKIGDLIKNKFRTKRKIVSKSGIISNKVDFCKTAISLMQTYDDLSKPAIDLVTKIYSFIEQENKLLQ